MVVEKRQLKNSKGNNSTEKYFMINLPNLYIDDMIITPIEIS